LFYEQGKGKCDGSLKDESLLCSVQCRFKNKWTLAFQKKKTIGGMSESDFDFEVTVKEL